MTAPLMWVRDGRTLPFVPVTHAALTAIAQAVPARRLPYARSMYLALLEVANDERDVRAAVSRRRLGERAGMSPETVSDIGPLLVDAGVLRIVERRFDGQRLENEWIVLEPSDAEDAGSSDPPASQAGGVVPRRQDPPASQARLSQEVRQEEQEETSSPAPRPRERAKRPDPDALPDDFPGDLVSVVDQVTAELGDAAAARGAPAPARAAVARALARRPGKAGRAIGVAERVHHWLVFNARGSRAPCRDVVARWRDWLDDEPDAPAPRPGAAARNGGDGRLPGESYSQMWGRIADELERRDGGARGAE